MWAAPSELQRQYSRNPREPGIKAQGIHAYAEEAIFVWINEKATAMANNGMVR